MNLPTNATRAQVRAAVTDNRVYIGANLRGANGSIFAPPPKGGDTTSRVGVVVTAGPNGEADYTDERYWVKLQQNSITSATSSTNSRLVLADQMTTGGPSNSLSTVIVTAYSLADLYGSSHDLAAGAIVSLEPKLIDVSTDSTGTPLFRWFIETGGGSPGVQFVYLKYASGYNSLAGPNGNATATYRYDLYDPSGPLLALNCPLVTPLPFDVSATTAQYGLAFQLPANNGATFPAGVVPIAAEMLVPGTVPPTGSGGSSGSSGSGPGPQPSRWQLILTFNTYTVNAACGQTGSAGSSGGSGT